MGPLKAAQIALLSCLLAYGAAGPLASSEETKIEAGRNNSTGLDGECIENHLLDKQEHAGAKSPSREGGRDDISKNDTTEKASDQFSVPKHQVSRIVKALTKRCGPLRSILFSLCHIQLRSLSVV